MRIIQAVLDARPGAYADRAALTSLADLLGLSQVTLDRDQTTAFEIRG